LPNCRKPKIWESKKSSHFAVQPLQRVRVAAKQQIRSEFSGARNHYNTRIARKSKKSTVLGGLENECIEFVDREFVDCTAGGRRARSRHRAQTESGNRSSLDDQGDMRFQARIGSDWAFYLYEPRESHAIYREAKRHSLKTHNTSLPVAWG
jgi:queuine/archaeosine tRNA-ribosyltransferase